jgi:hypothetical protein
MVQVEKPAAKVRIEGIVLLEPRILPGLPPEFGDEKSPLVQFVHFTSSPGV